MLQKEIFAKLKRNNLFELEPSEIHFAGFNLNQNENPCYKKFLKVINISDQLQRMTILPPQTKYFELSYVKQVLKLKST